MQPDRDGCRVPEGDGHRPALLRTAGYDVDVQMWLGAEPGVVAAPEHLVHL